MSVEIKKAVFGLALSAVVAIVAVPVAYWFILEGIRSWLGMSSVAPGPVWLILAAASFLIGIFWVSWSYSYLLFVGQGLPIALFGWDLHPTRMLVTTGPYAYTRNPSVLGVLFLLLGVALLQESVIGLILVPFAAVTASVYIFEFEEKGLARRFGREYEEYHANVPMLVPRLTPYIHEPTAA